ncbi:hypothetical protein PC111_g9969 [Phytophthora cactorum]|nr:hypothetical protein PC111_g9969 [Phytophthora cactorum]KAG3082350.1 hypothetical protein PC122_g10975 [Phytophthora cactorum]
MIVHDVLSTNSSDDATEAIGLDIYFNEKCEDRRQMQRSEVAADGGVASSPRETAKPQPAPSSASPSDTKQHRF